MKFLRVFLLVLVVHVSAAVILLFQPGCQMTGPRTAPPPETTAAPGASIAPMSTTRPQPTQPSGSVHSDFNAGFEPGPAHSGTPGGRTGGGRFAPTRPNGGSPSSGSSLSPNAVRPLDPFPLETSPDADLPGYDPLLADTVTHTVERGESAFAIARRYGISLNALLAANDLTPTSVIHPGDELTIPAQPGGSLGGDPTMLDSAPAPSSQLGTYVVERGDTLSGIAKRFGISLSQLRAANDLPGDLIRVGQTLFIPGGSAPAASSLRATTTPKPASPAGTITDEVLRAIGDVHIVERGDTLSGIASRYRVTVAELKSANNLTSDLIRPGQTLTIPGTGLSNTPAATPPPSFQPAPTPAPVRTAPTRPPEGEAPVFLNPEPPAEQPLSLEDLESLQFDDEEEAPLNPVQEGP